MMLRIGLVLACLIVALLYVVKIPTPAPPPKAVPPEGKTTLMKGPRLIPHPILPPPVKTVRTISIFAKPPPEPKDVGALYPRNDEMFRTLPPHPVTTVTTPTPAPVPATTASPPAQDPPRKAEPRRRTRSFSDWCKGRGPKSWWREKGVKRFCK